MGKINYKILGDAKKVASPIIKFTIMKKTISIIACVICVLSAQAQWFSIGARTGYSSTFTPENYKQMLNVTQNLQNGFHAGVFVRLGRTIYVQPEIIYNFSTYNSLTASEKSTLNIDGLKKYKIGTIDVPLLLGASLINTKRFKFRVMVGPKMSFNAGSTQEIKNINDMTQTIREARLGLDTGIGFDISRLTFDVRYYLIQNLYKIEHQNFNNNNELLHSIQASIGFRFGNNNKKKKVETNTTTFKQ